MSKNAMQRHASFLMLELRRSRSESLLSSIAVCLLAASKAAAEAALEASRQRASNLDLDDQAGPSDSTTGQVAAAGPGAQQTILTLFGKEEDCKLAQKVIEQEVEVSLVHLALSIVLVSIHVWQLYLSGQITWKAFQDLARKLAYE